MSRRNLEEPVEAVVLPAEVVAVIIIRSRHEYICGSNSRSLDQYSKVQLSLTGSAGWASWAGPGTRAPGRRRDSGPVPHSVCLPLSVIAVSLSPPHSPLQHLLGSNPTHIISEGEEVASAGNR